MKCRFEVDGVCTGKYEGFGCIKDRCDLYAQRCEYFVDSYCARYKRFFCTGDEDCSSYEVYIDHLRNAKRID